MSRSWKVTVCHKKCLLVEEMMNQQSSARSTSSTKQHKIIYQLRTNTTACTWPANDYRNGVSDHSNNKARRPPKSLLGGKKSPNTFDAIRDECMLFPGFFCGYCQLLLRPLRDAAQHQEEILLFLFLGVEDVWYTLAPCYKICHRQRTYCVIEHRGVWSYSYVPTSKHIACTRV